MKGKSFAERLSPGRKAMIRSPENCPYRAKDSANEQFTCRILPELTGLTDFSLCRVSRDACEACCTEVREANQVNPVIASLIYGIAEHICEIGGHPECSFSRAESLRRCATDHLTLDLPDAGQRFPPIIPMTATSPADTGRKAKDSILWAVAMLTAPRGIPQVEGTIESLFAAGFDRIHVYAEPGSLLPVARIGLQVTVNQKQLGNIRNFCTALTKLREQMPRADAFVVFQDDIRAAKGLRTWFEEQLWPLDCGVVSLFTPGLHADTQRGWRILSPGFQRVCGAQALVFR